MHRLIPHIAIRTGRLDRADRHHGFPHRNSGDAIPCRLDIHRSHVYSTTCRNHKAPPACPPDFHPWRGFAAFESPACERLIRRAAARGVKYSWLQPGNGVYASPGYVTGTWEVLSDMRTEGTG